MTLASAGASTGAWGQDFSGFARRAAAGSHAVMEVGQPHPVRLPGLATTRFELRPGDCGAPCPPDTERAELVETGAGTPAGALLYTAFSVFVPRRTAATPGLDVTLAAFEQEGRRVLAFQWRAEGLVAVGAERDADVLVPPNLLAGRWHDVLVEHRWSAGDGGFLRLWVNGQARPPRRGLNLGGSGPVRFAYGISRSPVSAWTARYRSLPPPQVVYFAHLRRDADRGAVDIDLRVR